MGKIDLEPHEWRSSDLRTKPHEPFFGDGLKPALAWLAGATIMFTVLYLAR